MREIDPSKFDRVLNHSGVKITVCKNRLEILVSDQSAMNDQKILNDVRSWLALHKRDVMVKDSKAGLNDE